MRFFAGEADLGGRLGRGGSLEMGPAAAAILARRGSSRSAGRDSGDASAFGSAAGSRSGFRAASRIEPKSPLRSKLGLKGTEPLRRWGWACVCFSSSWAQ